MAAIVGVVLAAAVLALALGARPASAFSQWQHDGATTCTACHTGGTPANASCTDWCHADFKAYPDMNCWSCHAPGADTSTLSTPGSACSQECHLWNSVQKQYIVPSTHGDTPHLGGPLGSCLGCHSTSPTWYDPGDSPHHSGEVTGFSECGACHSKEQKHVNKVACTKCHTTAQAFHTFTANSPGYKKCGACHTMRHAGKRVAANKCGACHKGSSGRAVQHSSKVTKNRVCSGCHKQKLHARSVSKKVTSCRTCHTKKFHAKQPAPPKSTCTKCHRIALRHDNGFRCTLCHRRAVHATRPSATN
jgi:hypothetical protein